MGEVQRMPEPGKPVATTDGMVSMLERVLMDASVPVERLERIIALHRDDRKDRARVAFSAAMAEMQCNLPVVDERGQIKTTKDANAKAQSTYAKWADINEAIMPVLRDHGFSLTFKIATPDKITVTGILSHRDGHSEETSITLPHDSSGSKNAVQAVASSVSYGKRYTAGALLNLTSRAKEDADDDGKAAGGETFISPEQEDELRDLLLSRELDEKRFLQRAKVERLADIAASRFEDAKRAILAAGARR